MDPITAIVLATVIGYAVASPDPLTLGVTRGSAGAIGSMARSTGRSINADRRAVAARRSAARQARLELLRKVRDNPQADPEKRAAARSALRRAAARDAMRAGVRSIGRAVKLGVMSMPEGFRSGASKAKKKRAEARALRVPVIRHSSDSGDNDWQGPYETPFPYGSAHYIRTDDGDVRGEYPQGYVPGMTLGDQETPANPGGQDTDLKENTVADATTIKTTELATTEDLRKEVAEAEAVVEAFAAQVTALEEWATGLAERYAATDWGTKDISAAVALTADAAPSLKLAAGLEAALTQLRKAIDAADVVAEARDAVQAEGDVTSFTAA